MPNEVDANAVIISLQEQIATLSLEKAVLAAQIKMLESKSAE